LQCVPLHSALVKDVNSKYEMNISTDVHAIVFLHYQSI